MMAERETNKNPEHHSLDPPTNQHAILAQPVDDFPYRMTYHSSIVHVFHQQLGHSSVMSVIPSLRNVETLAGGIPNNNRATTPQLRYGTGNSVQSEELQNGTGGIQSQLLEISNDINIGGISKVDIDSGTTSPAEQRNLHDREPKSDDSFQQNNNDCDHSAVQITRQESQLSPGRRKLDCRWHLSYTQLKEYNELHGNTVVPRGYTLNTKLASWVAEQRKQYRLQCAGKRTAMTPHRIRLLEDINFVWNAQEDAWCRQMAQLRRFHAEHGHCNVQVGNSDYPKLGLWIKEQRRHYMSIKSGKSSPMTLDRFRQLSEIGFCYDTHEAIWQERLSELYEFKRMHGHCGVSSSNVDARLLVWVHHQRRQHRKLMLGLPSHLTEARMQELDRLDFVWSPRIGRKKKHDEDDSDATITDYSSSDHIGSDTDGSGPPAKKLRKS